MRRPSRPRPSGLALRCTSQPITTHRTSRRGAHTLEFLHELDGHYAQSRMWRRAFAVPGGFWLGDHTFELVTAGLRCEPWKHSKPHDGCLCVGDLTYQAICEPCGLARHRRGRELGRRGLARPRTSRLERVADHPDAVA